jgi:hypothetical protein
MDYDLSLEIIIFYPKIILIIVRDRLIYRIFIRLIYYHFIIEILSINDEHPILKFAGIFEDDSESIVVLLKEMT